jgi:hypothetical protein
MADYLEQDNLPFIHPSEKPQPRKVFKRKFNMLSKLMKEKEGQDPPPIPLTKKGRPKKMSQTLRSCFARYKIDPYVK